MNKNMSDVTEVDDEGGAFNLDFGLEKRAEAGGMVEVDFPFDVKDGDLAAGGFVRKWSCRT
jgi:hypothetical protein